MGSTIIQTKFNLPEIYGKWEMLNIKSSAMQIIKLASDICKIQNVITTNQGCVEYSFSLNSKIQ